MAHAYSTALLCGQRCRDLAQLTVVGGHFRKKIKTQKMIWLLGLEVSILSRTTQNCSF